MPYEMVYRVQVSAAAAAGETVGATLVAVNADFSEPLNLNEAITSGLAFVRRFQSVNVDAEATIWGKPALIGAAAPASPAYVLTAAPGGDLGERVYAKLDAPSKGLLRRVSLANKPANEEEDLPDVELPAVGTATLAA